ncbi:MAG: FAD:protein FMN transferase, partial [Candidatus Binatia bacterium]
GWRVRVSGLGPGAAHGTVALRDRSLSTSRATGAGDEAGPVIDPRTREPVTQPRIATVLAGDATTADAWSTALIVLGREGLRSLEALDLDWIFEDEAGVERTRGFPLEH